MVNLALAYPILLLASIAVAIYIQVTSSTLSLPLSTGTTVLTIILPLIAAANVFYTPLLHRFLQARVSSLATQKLLPIALQVIQGILTVVLATLSAQGFVPGKLLECSLEGNWQRLFIAKDAHAIQQIQDSFNCCGLRSTKDRDWPLHQCTDSYKDRNSACLVPWRAAQQRTAGIEFAVVVVVGVLQLIHLALFRLRNSGGARARLGYRRITQSVGANPHEGLLENQAIDDDENDAAAGDSGVDGGRPDYGALEEGPNHRIEPSNLGEERNNWR
ncbi:uncharacterized protein GGS22DRAFT_143837 [Annulohypoxylon maeteangense]|uniref:uncharacterized protein n=1 Tax=Annulohypoxylon maeteangense TaxID=1927788 RepID=UPI002008DD42|nr:uncharacterized protein GGS22DRAFT_143837 [Annulohypoxylon maeteangense]KAI0884530.1 hypothetical protein GGS22DRAFT_143837 [Annulohypoxylon maeteangense]